MQYYDNKGRLRKGIYRKTELEFIEDAKKRLLSKRAILNNGCWFFRGSKMQDGYGRISYKKKLWLAHRLSLFIFKPNDYKECEQVNHNCDDPSCFNPDHLYSGTQSQNVLDSVARGRHFETSNTLMKRRISENANH